MKISTPDKEIDVSLISVSTAILDDGFAIFIGRTNNALHQETMIIMTPSDIEYLRRWFASEVAHKLSGNESMQSETNDQK